MMGRRLVAAPELTFPELSTILFATGWNADSQSEHPIIPGEPEWAVFSRPSGRIHYTFNPVVSLRALDLRGEEETAWQETASQLPVVDLSRLRSLLQSGDKRSTLLGLFAATELEEIGVLDLAIDLCGHSDARVAASALRLRDVLLLNGVAMARRILSKKQGIGEAFALPSGIELRRQTLRWVGHDNRESNSSIDQILRAGLADADVEVRITALLVAAKLNGRGVVEASRSVHIPESAHEGAPEGHRLFFREIHRAVLRYLTTGAATAAFGQFLASSLEVKDDPTLLLHSLITPVELGSRPGELPDAIESFENGYRLRKSGLAVRWIAPIEHWLGEGSSVHRVKAATGFFIAERALREPCSYEQARGHCTLLSRREGIEVLLPTSEQWEMAARGPDGRRFPWGNSLIAHWAAQASPWGVRETVGHGFEWTRALDGEPQACGSIELSSCAARTDAHPESATVRPIVEYSRRGD